MNNCSALEGLIMNTVKFKLGNKKVKWRILNVLHFNNRIEYRIEYRYGLFSKWIAITECIDPEANITISLLEDCIKGHIENRRDELDANTLF